MGVLRFKYIFFRSFVGSGGAFQVVFIFLLIPCCFTKDYRATPMLPNVSYLWAWNAPTEPCPKKFHVSIDLSLFSLIGNPQKDAVGQPVILFYVDRLGHYPHIDKNGKKEHGGIPQLGDTQSHLAKAEKDIEFYIPKDQLGLAIIDWEEWRPIWARNWKPKDIYKNESILLVQRQHPAFTLEEATDKAKEEFERDGRKFMVETLKLGKKLRPKYLWGFYLFPDCYNHQYTKPNYTGVCFDIEKKRNNELNWLWNESTALFPSIYLNTHLMNSPKAAPFVRNRVKEAIRVSVVLNEKSPLPVYIYTRPVFTDDSSKYLSQEDLIHTLGETISLGASGLIIWGSFNLSHSVDTCKKLHDYMITTMNPYIINITLAALMCSQVFCQEQGMCTRKDADSSAYLHLNSKNFVIGSFGNGTFRILGTPTMEDLKQFAEHFQCSCYSNTDCEKEVNFTQTIAIDVCMIEDVCIKAIVKSKNEIFHSSASLVLFLLFLIVLENEYFGMQTRL
ncbi:PREDICTED: hyaluronidase PH-20 [Myotis davidii]|uniref:hyaluronidase PH-20 n=1 Tax=Myotis davidii TaxID=225400 RepID=UPI0003EC03EA|nr:PREDICTED: hyaluronidase PH-20 [Myotis davidii]